MLEIRAAGGGYRRAPARFTSSTRAAARPLPARPTAVRAAAIAVLLAAGIVAAAAAIHGGRGSAATSPGGRVVTISGAKPGAVQTAGPSALGPFEDLPAARTGGALGDTKSQSQPNQHPGAAAEPVSDPSITRRRNCAATADAENGSVIVRRRQRGLGRLRVDNGSNWDAAVQLIDPGSLHAVAGMLVRAHHTADIDGVPQGEFDLQYAEGSGWDQSAKHFCRSVGFWRFDDRFRFTRTRRGDTLFYSQHLVTLHPVLGGNVSVDAIAPADFAANDSAP